MRKFLLLPVLCGWSSVAFAQATDCAAIKTENAALKDKIVAYEARLGIGVGGSTVEDGDADLKIKFVSCKASKATHKATLTFIFTNSGEPQKVVVAGAGSSNFGSNTTLVVDEQGQGYRSEDANPVVGGKMQENSLPKGVAVSCAIPLQALPTTITRLQAASICFYKFSPTNERTIVKSTIKNMPITWIP